MLDDFRKRVETVYSSETRDRATLLNEVRNLQQASERINKEAEHLARALKGDVKLQGNWGELVLERVLEASGLRAGEEYLVQAALRDGAGALKRPDVLIRLPDEKHVVVDAKLSLVAYEQALAAEDEASRESWLRSETRASPAGRSRTPRAARFTSFHGTPSAGSRSNTSRSGFSGALRLAPQGWNSIAFICTSDSTPSISPT